MDTAIVTGASSGIGLSITKLLLKQNYKVYGFGRDFSKYSNYFSIENNFIPISCNLMNTSSLCEKIKEISKNESIKILVNNAGVGYFGPHEELNPKKIHEIVTINLEVPLILSQLLLRHLKKTNGYIINISSIEAKKSSVYGCAYGATKAGLTHFSESLFDETRKYGVKVATIHPDMTKTDFYRNSNFKETEDINTYITPDEVAQAVNMVLSQRDSLVCTDITLRPQKHKIMRK
ncbi:MAG: SDR family oxidoreductase [Clostridium butyricum]|nr:SDR family oxidoreductase [Clostridium butyricum]